MIRNRRTPGRSAPGRADEPRPPPGENRRRIWHLGLALALLSAFLFVRPFVLEPLRVASGSMAPTLRAGDHVLAFKLAYRFGEPRRGDLAVFERGGEANIKRVVGGEGDVVEVYDGVLRIDGEPQREPYVDYGLTDSTFFGPVTVPEGHVVVMGDNRSNSLDSRAFGPVLEGDLSGRVLLRVWPPDRAGGL